MNKMERFVEGQAVRIPWGLTASRAAHVVEVWGEPARQIRVRFDTIDDGGPTTLLLSPEVVERVA